MARALVLPGGTDANDVALQNTAVPTARLSVGPKMWQPAATSAEYHMMLTKALGYAPNIIRKAFEEKCFTICWDIKKSPQDPTSAISARSGEMVRCEITNMTANAATEVHMTWVSVGVCGIRESGASHY